MFLKRLAKMSVDGIRSMSSRWTSSSSGRPAGAPSGKGRSWRTPANGNSRPARKQLHKIRGFRGFPELNETYLDLHASAGFLMRAELLPNPVDPELPDVPSSDSYFHFFVPLELSDIEPFDTHALTIPGASVPYITRPVDQNARGYPCNQLLEYYNNYVVKGTEVRCDLRAVIRNPGGSHETSGSWYQAGQVTLPVNVTLLRLTPEEIKYILGELPNLLGGQSSEYDEQGLARFDRVMREQFGSVPFTLTGDRMSGTVSTTYNCAVQNSTTPKNVTEGLTNNVDLLDEDQPFNKYMGVTGIGSEFAVIKHHPETKTYGLLVGWFNPAVLGEYLNGRPNTREVEIGMDFHIRQQIALGDVRSQASGISVGGNIVSRGISGISSVEPLVHAVKPGRGGVAKDVEPVAAPKLKRSKKVLDSDVAMNIS